MHSEAYAYAANAPSAGPHEDIIRMHEDQLRPNILYASLKSIFARQNEYFTTSAALLTHRNVLQTRAGSKIQLCFQIRLQCQIQNAIDPVQYCSTKQALFAQSPPACRITILIFVLIT